MQRASCRHHRGSENLQLVAAANFFEDSIRRTIGRRTHACDVEYVIVFGGNPKMSKCLLPFYKYQNDFCHFWKCQKLFAGKRTVSQQIFCPHVSMRFADKEAKKLGSSCSTLGPCTVNRSLVGRARSIHTSLVTSCSVLLVTVKSIEALSGTKRRKKSLPATKNTTTTKATCLAIQQILGHWLMTQSISLLISYSGMLLWNRAVRTGEALFVFSHRTTKT